MTQTYPFQRGSALDLADGQKLHADVYNITDRNAAQAADGLFWADATIVRNFSTKTTITNCGFCAFWDAFSSRWITGGASGGNPAALASSDGRDEWVALTVPAGTNWNATASGASNGAGSMVLGANPTSGTSSKIRQSADGGATWTARNTVASSTETVACLGWFAGGSVFIAGLDSPATTNIETSPDGITWTQRTGADSLQRLAIGLSPTLAVILNQASTNHIETSPDGITWTQRTLPATASWKAVTWNARSSKFMAIAVNQLATSPDGATWTSTGTPPFSTSARALVCFGRVWVAFGSDGGFSYLLKYSVDDGATWSVAKSVPTPSLVAGGLAVGDNQILHTQSSGIAYASLRGGL